jgi:uncharacterized membrane protein
VGHPTTSSSPIGAPDPYPFIFLTLLLSLQASYAAPLILLAQNRQTDRDRIQIQEDRERTERLARRHRLPRSRDRRPCASPSARSPPATTCDGELRDLLDDLDGRLEERAKAQRKAELRRAQGRRGRLRADTAPDD